MTVFFQQELSSKQVEASFHVLFHPVYLTLTLNDNRYLKKVDSFQNNHVHTFITGGNVKFMLLMNADPVNTQYSAYPTSPPSRPTTARQSTMLASNPSSQQTEEAVRQFMMEVSINAIVRN